MEALAAPDFTVKGKTMRNIIVLLLLVCCITSCFSDENSESITNDKIEAIESEMKKLEECSHQLGKIEKNKKNITIQELNSLLQSLCILI